MEVNIIVIKLYFIIFLKKQKCNKLAGNRSEYFRNNQKQVEGINECNLMQLCFRLLLF